MVYVNGNSFYTYLANGMVLVGEPTPSLESAAFTFLLPAGCCYDPPKRAGLASLTGEMMLRGAGPRDSRTWVSDLENLGVERGESVGVAQATFSRRHAARQFDAGIEFVCRPDSPAAFAGRSARSGAQRVLAGAAGDRR